MRNYSQSHRKFFLLVGAIVIALLIQGVIHIYNEVENFGAERKYGQGSVTYGTHSTATMPPMVQPSYTLHRTPYTVHHTPYTAHHTPSASSSMKIYTTSSAEVRHIGSGGGGGGGIATTNGISSSRRGITYGGASVAMPTLALVTPTYAYAAQERNAILGPRRAAKYEGEPTDGDYAPDDKDSDKWWKYDGEEWVEVEVRVVDGKIYAWNGNDWVLVTDKDQADPYVPVGATPWAVMAVLALLYTSRSAIRRKGVNSK